MEIDLVGGVRIRFLGLGGLIYRIEIRYERDGEKVVVEIVRR